MQIIFTKDGTLYHNWDVSDTETYEKLCDDHGKAFIDEIIAEHNNRQPPKSLEDVNMQADQLSTFLIKTVETSTATPMAEVGLLGTFPSLELGKTYTKNHLFSYNGKNGFIKQASYTHNAMPADQTKPVYEPFTVGTQSIFGARPQPDTDGIYPYTYNMAADVGMKVRDSQDEVWECYQSIGDMLYEPSELAAHFREV